MKKFTTLGKNQTQKLGELLAKELQGGEIICLSGDLGSGKTTFTQGLLKGLKIKGPYTSPTFVVMKHYKKKLPATQYQLPDKPKSLNIYHIDAYRIKTNDLLELGWKEFAGEKNSIIIIEWAERIKKIIPKNATRIKFNWISKNERELEFS